jgi:hypothetical protein
VRRPYIAESAIKPGCGVVQGSEDKKVAVSADGTGAFIGVYAFEDNEAKEAGDPVGIALSGVVKVLAGDTVSAGAKAALKTDDSDTPNACGSFITPAGPGWIDACGVFLESGDAGDYVDMMVERGSFYVSDGE